MKNKIVRNITHDSDSRNLIQCLDLVNKFGYEGYGLYWAIKELQIEWREIYYNQTYIIAYSLRISERRVRRIINFMVLSKYWALDEQTGKIING